jgi:urease accessory protein
MSAPPRHAIDRSPASLASAGASLGATARSGSASSSPGVARLEFRRRASAGKTVIGTAFAASPLRLLTPANHGDAAWVFLASLGGGLLDGDRIDVHVEVGDGASALLGTQASTKVYRSPQGGAGSSQRLRARVGAGALLAVVPDPVVCFADSRYQQSLEISLAPSASLWLVDGYSCGRSARGERWAFSHYASRTTVFRGGARSIVDATRLDPGQGPLAGRMGRFDVVLSVLVVGPRFAHAREAMLASSSPESTAGATTRAGDSVLVAASPLGEGACILRVAAERFESASRALRSSFALLAAVLGDDPFARKW